MFACKSLCAMYFAFWDEIFCEHSSLQQHPCDLSVTKKCLGKERALAHTKVGPPGVPQHISFKNTTLVSPLSGTLHF